MKKVFISRNSKQAPREKEFTPGRELKIALASVMRELLSAFGVPCELIQEVDFVFHADTRSAAERLATVLAEMEYAVLVTDTGGGDTRFRITGLTTKMQMDDLALQLWTEKMCGLADRYSCEFDGWGTIVETE